MCIQGSVLFGETRIPSGFVTYFAKNMTTKVFLRDATEVPLYALLLFGGKVTVNRQSPQGPLPFRPARLAFFFSDYMPSVLSLLNESLFRADFASGRTSLPRDLPSFRLLSIETLTSPFFPLSLPFGGSSYSCRLLPIFDKS
jgi:hypothetical protein